MTTAAHSSERARDVDRKRDKSREQKLVRVPACENLQRRLRLESNDIEWLMYYFGPESEVRDPFTYEFTTQQREMIHDFGVAINEGGDQAVAASRGEGKTTILERLIIKYTLQGSLFYSVLFHSTATLAENSLDSMKTAIEENPLLAADYPEVCVPVQALESTPNRAHYQVVSGFRHDNGEAYEMASSRFTWCGQEVILPKVPGSPAGKSIIATRGLDSAVRGLKKRGMRPQFAAIDDPDTEETAFSEVQAKKLEDRIDKAIGGLGSQTKPIARILLTTIQSRVSVSFKFTNRENKPSWKGKRFRFLITPPDNASLWEEFVRLKKMDWETGLNTAQELYVSRRAEMEAGAVVANPNRFTAKELSALEHYYTLVARLGQEAVSTEYDNDPPIDDGRITSGISKELVRRQVSGCGRKVIPAGCTILVHASDVGKTKGFHWQVRAYKPDGTFYVIDYGIMDVKGTKYGSDEGLDRAIYNAVRRRHEEFLQERYCFDGGEVISDPVSVFDSRYRTDAVMRAVKDIGLGVYAIKGIGTSAGAAIRGKYRRCSAATPTRKPGNNERFYWDRDNELKLWAIHADTDHWKAWEHDRWLTAIDRPGCAFIWGDSETPMHQHETYAKHICSEIETEEIDKKGVPQRRFVSQFSEADWLDTGYYCDVLAAMKGARIITESPAVASSPAERMSLSEMAKRAQQ